MEDDIITIIYEKKEDDDLFDFKSKELVELEKTRTNRSKDLYAFIRKRVHPKSQRTLEDLIEKYVNAYVETSFCENKLYYRSGFSDGISIIKKALAEH